MLRNKENSKGMTFVCRFRYQNEKKVVRRIAPIYPTYFLHFIMRLCKLFIRLLGASCQVLYAGNFFSKLIRVFDIRASPLQSAKRSPVIKIIGFRFIFYEVIKLNVCQQINSLTQSQKQHVHV